MPRPKRLSHILEKAQKRASGMQAIDPNLDFGNSNSLQNMLQQIEELRTQLNAYHTALAVVNASRIEIEQLEKSLSVLCENMLMSVAGKYGKDSSEYVMAGGMRKSERIHKGTINRLKGFAEKPRIDG
ncbi:MAG: hypothetical protein RMX68_020815 [Aulosira sp. ZfuVER01]|nr:hypothetical protein [Aulosira sp. ZfuVER01]MDZ8002567.1 hypothetical protein [Aulosira sp. DedVER01a]MDZ8050755.1 hypothetical protein [Aulosira sp. ZfuCHP01]